jgi:hypothetical protein
LSVRPTMSSSCEEKTSKQSRSCREGSLRGRLNLGECASGSCFCFLKAQELVLKGLAGLLMKNQKLLELRTDRLPLGREVDLSDVWLATGLLIRVAL